MRRYTRLFFLLAVVSAPVTGCGGSRTEKPVAALSELNGLTEEQIEEKIIGFEQSKIAEAWGEPVMSLFGMDGDMYELDKDKKGLIVYYGGDGRRVVDVRLSEKENDTSQEMEQSAPSITLRDVLSSTMNEFIVTSGNYTWNFKKGDEMTGVIACGAHPLYEAKDKEPLKLPRYSGSDHVTYSISCTPMPSRVTVYEYSIEDLEGSDVQPISSRAYEEALLPELKAGRVYELFAQWDEEKLEKNGGYGTASYVVVTE